MSIISYTTTIDAYRTIGEIQEILVKHGAQKIMLDFEQGQPAAITFALDAGSMRGLPIRLPAKPEAVERILKKMKAERKGNMKVKPDFEQACRVAWRLILRWVEVQMSMVALEQAEMAEIFMPYIMIKPDQSLYEQMRESRFMLPGSVADWEG